MLTEASQANIRLAVSPQSSDVARIEAYHVVLSDYVVLLEQLDMAWTQLVAAVKAPSNPIALNALTRTSSQIVTDAKTIQLLLAQMRRGVVAQ
jgi:hypothetical protein